MTVLSACQEAAVELSQPDVSSLFSTTDRFAKELRVQANKAATAIAKVYDWQALTVLQTMTGDGTTASFPLPDDYDRMPVKAQVMTSQFSAGLVKARDLDFWLDQQIYSRATVPGYWIILGGAMQTLPMLASGVFAKFYYQRNTIVKAADASLKTKFTSDDDTFILSERLLTLAIIWRWRASKRREYAEDLQNYEIALAEETGRDKGSRTLVVGRQRLPGNIHTAYPVALG